MPTIIRAVLMIPNHCSHKNQRPSHIAIVLKIEKLKKKNNLIHYQGSHDNLRFFKVFKTTKIDGFYSEILKKLELMVL